MSLAVLQTIWFLLVAVLILGYAILAGFDLGVGNLHLLSNQKEREQNFYNIAPFWDSNQVWLLTGGGALFAAFPHVYATAFSGFYPALMLLLLAMIVRAAAIEFQHLLPEPEWKAKWDWGFGIGSIVASTLFGVAMGNVLRGLPLDSTHNFTGSFFGLLNPYSLVVGLLALTMFTLHGASFLVARSQGDLINKAKRWGSTTWKFFAVLFTTVTIWSYLAVPRLFENFFELPILWVLPFLVIAAIAYYPKALENENRWMPLLVSTINIAGLIGIVGASLFPNMIPAVPNPANSLTIYNASSTKLTLTTMLIIALLGVPLVIAYTTYVYRKLMKDYSQTGKLHKKANMGF
ncbi:cytochrome d ubiquinol oxidase subunit II [Calderihabitans maritimus]|uniref:Cytochrome bd ubiquinol oxidase, subunit ii n=1 Tax=Calderihabitans maritimus TaxID=1246530 RepID=A0A1Z5HP37_9FIRM|nr:cytochrome d ubiquinol oxidase subunit II [Calderihabitans maritimus]GAW91198.1 cytochrome bd ubiquinol oxidase, subunit ii [Calderihabitans maritimus]